MRGVLELAVAFCVLVGGCKAHGAVASSDAGHDVPDAVAVAASATGLTLDAAPADDEIPPNTSDDLTQRARHLLDAVAKDNPDLAADIVFPRDGWIATRDAADPGKEWEKHVAAPFRRSIAAHARHHEELDRAQFVSFELGHSVEQVAMRRHGWKKSLWMVHGSRLTFLVDGHTRTMTVREMTAWRGAWYVTRLR